MVRYGRETGREMRMALTSGAPCIHCGVISESAYEDDTWYHQLQAKFPPLPSEEVCEAFLEKWDISDQTAEETVIQICAKLAWDDKRKVWWTSTDRGKRTYVDLYRVWQSWCISNSKTNRNRNHNGHNGWKPQAPRSRYI